jgi:endonuclease/exonuclease/phosphatase family metal-dependent hydrolase
LLARGAGYPYYATQRNVDAQLPGLRLEFGNALLSRHPIADARLVDYPALRVWERLLVGHKRGLVASVHPPDAPPLRVAVVHLEHRSEQARVAAAQNLLALSRSSGPPLVLAGDFNSTPDGFPGQLTDDQERSALSLLLRSGRFHACTEIEPDTRWFSFRADRPTRLIDWVLLPPELRFLGCQTIKLDRSDHRPVLIELELPRRAAP